MLPFGRLLCSIFAFWIVCELSFAMLCSYSSSLCCTKCREGGHGKQLKTILMLFTCITCIIYALIYVRNLHCHIIYTGHKEEKVCPIFSMLETMTQCLENGPPGSPNAVCSQLQCILAWNTIHLCFEAACNNCYAVL